MTGPADLTRQIKGQVDGIGTQPRLRARGADGADVVDQYFERDQVPDVPAALHTAGTWLREEHDINPIAVGHRVVHGGPKYDRPVLVDAQRACRSATIHPPGASASAQQSGAYPVDSRTISATAAGRLLRYSLPPRSRRRRGSLRDPGAVLASKACVATASMGCPTSTSPSAYGIRLRGPRTETGHRCPSGKWRFDVRLKEWAQR